MSITETVFSSPHPPTLQTYALLLATVIDSGPAPTEIDPTTLSVVKSIICTAFEFQSDK